MKHIINYIITISNLRSVVSKVAMVNFGNEFESGNPQVELYRLCWDQTNQPENFVCDLNRIMLEARSDERLRETFNIDERLRAPGDKTNSYTALMMLCERGKAQEAAFLIAQGASLTATTNKGETPLHIAARSSSRFAAQVTSMIAEKLDRQGLDAADCTGWTPLMLAVKKGCERTCEVLIDRGSRVNRRNDLIGRMTPLLMAADTAEYPIVLALLQAQADISCTDEFGNSALHRVCMEPVKKGVRFQLKLNFRFSFRQLLQSCLRLKS